MKKTVLLGVLSALSISSVVAVSVLTNKKYVSVGANSHQIVFTAANMQNIDNASGMFDLVGQTAVTHETFKVEGIFAMSYDAMFNVNSTLNTDGHIFALYNPTHYDYYAFLQMDVYMSKNATITSVVFAGNYDGESERVVTASDEGATYVEEDNVLKISIDCKSQAVIDTITINYTC